MQAEKVGPDQAQRRSGNRALTDLLPNVLCKHSTWNAIRGMNANFSHVDKSLDSARSVPSILQRNGRIRRSVAFGACLVDSWNSHFAKICPDPIECDFSSLR